MSTTTVSRIAEAKRLIGKDNGPPNLILAEHDGVMWATNSYWLTRAERVNDLLGKFNLTGPGSFNVGASVRKAETDRPMSKLPDLLALSSYGTELTRVMVAGYPAYMKGGDFIALFERPDGVTVGVKDDQLTWLSDLGIFRYSSLTYSEPRYLFNGTTTIAVVCDVKALRPGTGQSDGGGRWVPAEYDDKGTEVIGVVMQYKLSRP